MSYYSPTIRALPLFQEKCDERTQNGLYDKEMKRALGEVLIECSNFFTADIQPICTEQGLAYAISQYGSDDVIVVRDEDYPDMELPEWCSSELLPLGFRKAAALSETLHAENIKKFDIHAYEDEKDYAPQDPYRAYLRSIGQPMPVDEYMLKCSRKIADNKFFKFIRGVLGYALLCGIGGILLAFIQDGNVRGYMYGGALIGVVFYLISLFYSKAVGEE